MFEKRLFSLVPESVPPIVASVVFKWIALACNIGVMWILAGLLESIFANGADLARAQHAFALASPGFVALIAARATSIYLAQRMGDKAALLAVARVRSLVLTSFAPWVQPMPRSSPPPRPYRQALKAPRNFRFTLEATCRSFSSQDWRRLRFSSYS